MSNHRLKRPKRIEKTEIDENGNEIKVITYENEEEMEDTE